MWGCEFQTAADYDSDQRQDAASLAEFLSARCSESQPTLRRSPGRLPLLPSPAERLPRRRRHRLYDRRAARHFGTDEDRHLFLFYLPLHFKRRSAEMTAGRGESAAAERWPLRRSTCRVLNVHRGPISFSMDVSESRAGATVKSGPGGSSGFLDSSHRRRRLWVFSPLHFFSS